MIVECALLQRERCKDWYCEIVPALRLRYTAVRLKDRRDKGADGEGRGAALRGLVMPRALYDTKG